MTTYGAYDKGLPCKNTSCKSHGVPHPNCRCYGDMAKGGSVEPFCSADRPHEKTCQYFAEGGDVAPSWEDTKPVGEASGPSWDETTPVATEPTWENTSGKYDSVGQKIGGAIEAVGRGVAGPLATGAEKLLSKAGVPGLSDEDITGRKEALGAAAPALETAGLVGSMMIPGGAAVKAFTVAGMAGKAANVAAKAVGLAELTKEAALSAKIGSAAIQSAVQGGLFQFSDNASKAMLGQGNPEDSVAGVLADGIGTSMLFGGSVGAAAPVASGLLSSAGEGKAGTYLHSFLAGIGESSKGLSSEASIARGLSPTAYDKGAKMWEALNKKISLASPVVSAGYGAERGYEEGGIEGALLGGLKGMAFGLGASGAGWAAKKALSGPVSAGLLKMIGSGEMQPRALFQGLNYANQVARGAQKINRSVESLFKAGGQKALDFNFSKERERFDKYFEDGGINQDIQQETYNSNEAPQGFAEGGAVSKQIQPQGIMQNSAVATHFPEQNVMLNAAKGRISNYLSGVRPQKNQPKLAFDSEPDQRSQQKSYDKALDIAMQPLSILQKIQTGTVDLEHVKHFKAMYPELDGVLQKKLSEKITEAQIKKEKPSYKVRQGISLFLGVPLSGEMTPQNIQAAQAVFQTKGQPQQAPQPVTKNKKNTSTLSKMDDPYQTSSQARIARQQKV